MSKNWANVTCEDIAQRVSHFGESYEVVGLLHDAIEDADPKEFQEAVIADIKASFSNEIFQSILAMTKKSGEISNKTSRIRHLCRLQ